MMMMLIIINQRDKTYQAKISVVGRGMFRSHLSLLLLLPALCAYAV